jgi:hypothetical protein
MEHWIQSPMLCYAMLYNTILHYVTLRYIMHSICHRCTPDSLLTSCLEQTLREPTGSLVGKDPTLRPYGLEVAQFLSVYE